MFSKNSLFALNNVIIIHLSCLSRQITKNKSSGSRTDLYMNSICTQTRLNTQIYRYRFNRSYMPHKKLLACNILLFGRTLCIFKRCVKLGKVHIYIQKVCSIERCVYSKGVLNWERCVYSKGVQHRKVCIFKRCVKVGKVCSVERCVISKGV